MKKIWVAFLALVMVGEVLFSASAKPSLRLTMASAEAAPAEPITLMCAEIGPPKGYRARGDQWFAQQVEKQTEGRVKIKFYWGGSLLGVREMLQGVRKGVADMGMNHCSWMPKEMPVWYGLIVCPFLPKWQDPRNVVDAVWALWDEFPAFRQDMERWNQTLLIAPPFGAQHVFSKRPLKGLKDVKGLKLRIALAPHGKAYAALGAHPVRVKPGEIYTALSKGTIDSADVTFDQAMRFGVVEVATHCLLTNLATGPGMITINKDSLAKLSKKDRETLLRLGREASRLMAQWAFEEEKKLRAKWQGKLTFVKVPKADIEWWIGLPGVNLVPGWIKEREKTGFPAREFMKRVLSLGGAPIELILKTK